MSACLVASFVGWLALWGRTNFVLPHWASRPSPVATRSSVGLWGLYKLLISVNLTIANKGEGRAMLHKSNCCFRVTLSDWLIEQGLTSHQTHYSYRGRFLQVIWPNQQCTEESQLVFQIRLESHQDHSLHCYNNTTLGNRLYAWRKGLV